MAAHGPGRLWKTRSHPSRGLHLSRLRGQRAPHLLPSPPSTCTPEVGRGLEGPALPLAAAANRDLLCDATRPVFCRKLGYLGHLPGLFRASGQSCLRTCGRTLAAWHASSLCPQDLTLCPTSPHRTLSHQGNVMAGSELEPRPTVPLSQGFLAGMLL